MATFCSALLLLLSVASVAVDSATAAATAAVAAARDIHVDASGFVPLPIRFSSNDYTGPYDPLDPKGVNAALHRRAKVTGTKAVQAAKSYVPPGIDKVAAKEVKKIAVSEGKHFVVAHPAEAAELADIATKTKVLVDQVNKKVEHLEKKERGN